MSVVTVILIVFAAYLIWGAVGMFWAALAVAALPVSLGALFLFLWARAWVRMNRR